MVRQNSELRNTKAVIISNAPSDPEAHRISSTYLLLLASRKCCSNVMMHDLAAGLG